MYTYNFNGTWKDGLHPILKLNLRNLNTQSNPSDLENYYNSDKILLWYRTVNKYRVN